MLVYTVLGLDCTGLKILTTDLHRSVFSKVILSLSDLKIPVNLWPPRPQYAPTQLCSVPTMHRPHCTGFFFFCKNLVDQITHIQCLVIFCWNGRRFMFQSFVLHSLNYNRLFSIKLIFMYYILPLKQSHTNYLYFTDYIISKLYYTSILLDWQCTK